MGEVRTELAGVEGGHVVGGYEVVAGPGVVGGVGGEEEGGDGWVEGGGE